MKKLSNKPKLEDSRATKQVVALLSAPLEKYSDIVTSLTLSNYPRVMDHLDNETNKIMAMVIIQSIMTNHAYVSSADKVNILLISQYCFSFIICECLLYLFCCRLMFFLN